MIHISFIYIPLIGEISFPSRTEICKEPKATETKRLTPFSNFLDRTAQATHPTGTVSLLSETMLMQR